MFVIRGPVVGFPSDTVCLWLVLFSRWTKRERPFVNVVLNLDGANGCSFRTRLPLPQAVATARTGNLRNVGWAVALHRRMRPSRPPATPRRRPRIQAGRKKA